MRLIDDHSGIEVIDRRECLQLLASQQVGRVAVIVGHQPLVFPVNYIVDGETIVFRTDEGAKLFGATQSGYLSAFEIDGTDVVHRAGWSVLVVGRAVEVARHGVLELLSRVGLRPWAPGDKAHWVRIEPHRITGRRVAGLGG